MEVDQHGLPPRTNHSLRATGATTRFQAEVPERIIEKTTGHMSLESLCTYERILKRPTKGSFQSDDVDRLSILHR